jgi:hypothetical protein
MLPVKEISQLLAWGGLGKGVRLSHAAGAKIARWLWPPVTTLIAAQRAALFGFVACIVIGADFFGTDLVFASRLPLSLVAMAPVLHLVISAGWFFAGLAILKYSRAAALVALAGYIALHAHRMVSSGRGEDLGSAALMLVLVLMLARAARGVFAYHRMPRESGIRVRAPIAGPKASRA